MPREPGTPRVHRSSLQVLAAGVLLIAAYAVLAEFTGIGDLGDIGGGLILLLGYLTTAAGLFLVGHDLWETRTERE